MATRKAQTPRGLKANRPNPRDARLEVAAERLIAGEELLPNAGALVVGVSGGPDSVALLHFLRDYGARTGLPPGGLVVGHVEHGLRGAESEADAAFVLDLSRSLGIPALEARVDPAARRCERGESPEQAARALRYEALRDMAARSGADRVAVAHTADDQAETVLLRLIRGAGLRGLAGMPARGRVEGVRVVRPLLGATREQVLDYLRRNGLQYRVDSTNADRRVRRNYVRHEIWPRLEALNPSMRRTLLREARAFREADRYLSDVARSALPALIASREPGKIGLDAGRLLDYPKVLRKYVFRHALQELNGEVLDLSSAHIDALLSLLQSPAGRSADLAMGLRAWRERGEVMLGRRAVGSAEPRHRRRPSKT